MEFSDNELNEILHILQTESEETIARINNCLIKLEKTPHNKDLINEIFRNAHSLKGASRMVGFNSIQTLAHKLEDILESASSSELLITAEVIDELCKTIDIISHSLKKSIDAQKEVVSPEIFNQISVLESLLISNKSEVDEISRELHNSARSANIISKKSTINNMFKEVLSTLEKIPYKKETKLISDLLEKINLLYQIFAESELYEIKYPIEDVKVKLEFVKKVSNELTLDEIIELRNKLNEANSKFASLCIDNSETISDKIEKLGQNPDIADEISEILSSLKTEDTEAVEIANAAIEILDFIKQKKITPEDQMRVILKNSIDYCINHNAGADNTLVVQQLGVLKQILELNYESETALTTRSDNNGIYSVFNEGTEIKTLHVNSARLDAFVTQLGELIISEMKLAKHIDELSEVKKNIENWHEETAKALDYIKYFARKYELTDTKSEMLINQLSRVLEQGNKQAFESIKELVNFTRKTKEDDMKINVITNTMESMIKNIRILPISTVFGAFPRMVRDIAREKGKEIELIIQGDETGADKKIIEEIKTPLIHIIRNSIDHGIEFPEQREKSGKNRAGKILLRATQEDNKVKIDIIDDGQGFNLAKIKDKALKKGFLTQEELTVMTDDEITNIIFWPGFTTEDNVSDISGRGIGLDVVKTKLAQLNGKIKVISEFGKGCCTSIEIPVTLTTLKAFLVEVSGQIFAIPIPVIETFIWNDKSEIRYNNGKRSILYDGKIIPLYYLSDILELTPSSNRKKEIILIVELDNSKTAIVVDKLLGDQDILQKNLPPPIYKLKNISGITNLASGDICLVLNMSDILKNAALSKIATLTSPEVLAEDIESYKNILLIDNSETSNSLVKDALTNSRLNVDISKNAEETLLQLKKNHYDLIIADCEMPETITLEFLETIKNDEMYSDIPMILIASYEDKKIKKSGIDGYILKREFEQEKFMYLVKELLAKYHDR